MTVPAYLANAFNFLETPTVTDVLNTIARMKTQALALGWTNPVGDTLVSPANSVGQQITVALSKISATNLQMVFTDSLGRTITRRCQTPASFTERLYFNTFGFAFDPGNGEGLWGCILDLTPELQSAHDQFATCHGTRTAADAIDVTMSAHASCPLSSASPRVYTPTAVTTWFARGSLDSFAGQRLSQSLSRMWYPNVQLGFSTGVVWRVRGRVPQSIFCSSAEAAQSEFTVPLDQATTGLFKVLSWVSVAAAPMVLAMRKA